MTKIKFLPWVGKNYAKGIEGKRVMALGESHYCADPAEAIPSITVDVIKDLFDADSEHEGYKNTYTKFIRALSGRKISTAAEKEHEWNKILFYNYVQFPISGTRQSPTQAEFAASEYAFFEVLEQYQPEVVIVWGARLYNRLPRRGFQGEDLIFGDNESLETWYYELTNGHKVHLLPITHPSAGFSPEYWHKAIESILR